jgi:hypothetical protein
MIDGLARVAYAMRTLFTLLLAHVARAKEGWLVLPAMEACQDAWSIKVPSLSACRCTRIDSYLEQSSSLKRLVIHIHLGRPVQIVLLLFETSGQLYPPLVPNVALNTHTLRTYL